MADSNEYEIGTSVRVKSKDGNYSKRAIISCINSNYTCDIIFENKIDTKLISEEENVEHSRISQLLDFELNTLDESFGPNQLKEQGNILFVIKDFESASFKYLKSLQVLKKHKNPVLSIGAIVIVTPSKEKTDIYIASDLEVHTHEKNKEKEGDNNRK